MKTSTKTIEFELERTIPAPGTWRSGIGASRASKREVRAGCVFRDLWESDRWRNYGRRVGMNQTGNDEFAGAVADAELLPDPC
jgi:hypothetical protein